MSDDKPKPEPETADGREVFVTTDESGITSLAEEEEAADPRVTTDSGDGSSGDVGESDDEADVER